MNDTSKEFASLMRARLLMKDGAERVQMGSQMFEVARTLAVASFPSGLSELEIKRRLCERFYGTEVDVAAFIAHLSLARP